MIFITFNRHDKTCLKTWFVLVHWVAKKSKTNEKLRTSYYNKITLPRHEQ